MTRIIESTFLANLITAYVVKDGNVLDEYPITDWRLTKYTTRGLLLIIREQEKRHVVFHPLSDDNNSVLYCKGIASSDGVVVKKTKSSFVFQTNHSSYQFSLCPESPEKLLEENPITKLF